MKALFLFPVLLSFLSLAAQQSAFPASWTGNWKGNLHWYKGTSREPKVVNMELRIKPLDSAGVYTWQIIYGAEATDNRPYLLVAKDTAKGLWSIDERNGIVLEQAWIANRFCGTFTVGGSTIVNSYWVEDGKLHCEFYSMGAKPVNTSGKGTEESPSVDSYRMNSYQRAVLHRQ